MSDLLKGNFKVEKEVVEQDGDQSKSRGEEIQDHLKKQALANICGSMVYVEQTELTWDGDEDESTSQQPSES